MLGDLASRQIEGHLPEDAAFLLAEVREAKKDYKGAVAVYESLVARKLAQPQVAWLRLGLAADRAGLPMRSVEALQRVYYDYPDHTGIRPGREELDRQDVDIDAGLAPKELARAETLFQARRWSMRATRTTVRAFVTGDDRDRVSVRLAASDVGLGRHARAASAASASRRPARRRSQLPLRQRGARAEAEGRASRPGARVRRQIPGQPVRRRSAERPGVGVHHRRRGCGRGGDLPRDGRSLSRRTLRRARGLEGRLVGLSRRALRRRRAYFDNGAAQFPRSDFRPSWLYWSGRATQQVGDIETGIARLRLAATDYHNSYYGRLAWSA